MDTLAQFIQRKREALGLTPLGLSHKCNVPTVVIEEIEAGRELFLSVTIRQNLAKGLKCSPEEIKILEKDFVTEEVPMEVMDVLKQRILTAKQNSSVLNANLHLLFVLKKCTTLKTILNLFPEATALSVYSKLNSPKLNNNHDYTCYN